MKYRVSEWFDSDTLSPVFGVQIFTAGKWMNCSRGKEPLFFGTRGEAEAEIERINSFQSGEA